MRHHNTKRKFGREKVERNALLNSLALNLITREKIKTSLPKAKELRPYVEKLITAAKKSSLSKRKFIMSKLGSRGGGAKKLFEVIAPKYLDKNGGYTRVLKLGPRKSDSTHMAIIEFV